MEKMWDDKTNDSFILNVLMSRGRIVGILHFKNMKEYTY